MSGEFHEPPNDGLATSHRIDKCLRRIHWPLFVMGAVSVGLFKVGVFFVGSPPPIANFPEPLPTASAISYGNRTVAFVLGWEFPSAYSIISLFLTGLSIAVLGLVLRPQKFGVDSRLLAILIVLGPMGQVLMTNIGGHDAWMFVGALVIGVLGKSVKWAIVGVILMLLGNPEQAVVATFTLLLMTLIPDFKVRRKPTFTAFTVAMVCFITLSVYASFTGASSRLGYLSTYITQGLENFSINLPLSLFAALGINWIVVVWFITRMQHRQRLILITSTLVIPMALTAITVDQTRVFVGLSSAVVVVILVEAVPRIRAEAESIGYQNYLFWTAALAIFLPAILVTFDGSIHTPYSWLFSKVGNVIPYSP